MAVPRVANIPIKAPGRLIGGQKLSKSLIPANIRIIRGTMKFIPHIPGIRALFAAPEMQAAMHINAEAAAEGARAVAREDAYDTGQYMNSIEVTSGVGETGMATGRVLSTDFKAHWVEFGAGPSPYRGGNRFRARAPLRKGAERVGFKFQGERRYRFRG